MALYYTGKKTFDAFVLGFLVKYKYRKKENVSIFTTVDPP